MAVRRARRCEPAAWWPPKVGDKLRDSHWPEYLQHVVSVFEHRGRTVVVVAYFGLHKQWWHYEVIRSIDTAFDRYALVPRARKRR